MNDDRIDLDRARREAKQLLAAARRGEPDALARLRADRTPRLADAQHAVARTHGDARWVDLVHAHHDAGAALRDAALAGDDDALYALLEAGAPPNARDPVAPRCCSLRPWTSSTQSARWSAGCRSTGSRATAVSALHSTSLVPARPWRRCLHRADSVCLGRRWATGTRSARTSPT